MASEKWAEVTFVTCKHNFWEPVYSLLVSFPSWALRLEYSSLGLLYQWGFQGEDNMEQYWEQRLDFVEWVRNNILLLWATDNLGHLLLQDNLGYTKWPIRKCLNPVTLCTLTLQLE